MYQAPGSVSYLESPMIFTSPFGASTDIPILQRRKLSPVVEKSAKLHSYKGVGLVWVSSQSCLGAQEGKGAKIGVLEWLSSHCGASWYPDR